MNGKIFRLFHKIHLRFSIKYLIITITALIMMTCKSKTIQSQWNQTDIKIDGETSDWQCSNTYFNEDFNMVYGICNNDQYLNILIRFQDKNLARKILTQGFVIWLDKERTKGVRYIDYVARDRIIDHLMERSDHRPRQQMRLPKNEKVNWLSGNFYLIEGDLEEKLSGKDNLEIRAAAGEENMYFCLEYEIKFSYDTSEDVMLSLNDKNKFRTALEISRLPENVQEKLEQQFNKGPGRGGMPGAPNGEHRGGMPGGGPPGGGRFNPLKQFEEQIIWLDIILAKTG